MNREQMIAWLTLEGWDIATDKSKMPTLRRGDDRVWIAASGKYVADGTVRDIDGSFVATEEPLDHDKLSDKHLAMLYKYLMDLEAACK